MNEHFTRVLIRNRWNLLLAASALLLAAMILSPMLRSGFFGDDAINSSVYARSALMAEGRGLPSAIAELLAGWMKSGRFFPVMAYMPALFYVLDGNVLALKIIVFAIVLADIGMLGYLVYQATASAAAAVLTMLAVPLFIQFRAASFHDPVLGFAGLLPLITAITLISLVALVAYMRSGHRYLLIISLVAYATCLLTYEIAIPFAVIYFSVIWLFPKRHPFLRALRMSWPFFALALGAVVAALIMRLLGGVALTGTAGQFAHGVSAGGDPAGGAYVMNLVPGAVLVTLAKQVVAALPLSYQTWDNIARANGLFPGLGYALRASLSASLLIAVGYAAILSVALTAAWREVADDRPRFDPTFLVVLGAELLLAPSLLIALSPRYQAEVYWGVGYLPVYVSCFGLALLVAGITYFALTVSRRQPGGALVFVAIGVLCIGCCAYVGVTGFQNNRLDVEAWNRGATYPRALMTDAAAHGLFSGLQTNPQLILSNRAPWETKSFYDGAVGRPVASLIDASDLATALDRGSLPTAPSEDARDYTVHAGKALYALKYGSAWNGNGYVLLGRVSHFHLDPYGRAESNLDATRVYVIASSPRAAQIEIPTHPLEQGLGSLSVDSLGLDPSQFSQVASGPGWGYYQALPHVSVPIKF